MSVYRTIGPTLVYSMFDYLYLVLFLLYEVVDVDVVQSAATKQQTAEVDEFFGVYNLTFGKEIERHGHAVKGQNEIR